LAKIAEPIPMKRELKLESISAWQASDVPIAEPIPMKRELKQRHLKKLSGRMSHCRAYPDEKGIETPEPEQAAQYDVTNCRAYPDEKGIETTLIWSKVGVSSNILQSLSR